MMVWMMNWAGVRGKGGREGGVTAVDAEPRARRAENRASCQGTRRPGCASSSTGPRRELVSRLGQPGARAQPCSVGDMTWQGHPSE